ncbi:WecB/TagA/CpsF family glycosyltransferase [Herpetosiphon llansteffanensis]|uniref:WecB/TagA/CpsF family glycosyltransferase n=1 Tax=Herpetosiphon llansteffanensis TaxID=2094568 RepID=UPI000D7C83B7|nr:WecB/TagA/CpsF family glycosyltransferase [Herpetosiphon llansteffanensis]
MPSFQRPADLASVEILGVRVDDVTMDETVDLIAAMLAAGGVHQIATVNPEFVMAAQTNVAFRATLAATSLSVPDGTGLLHAARWQGKQLRAKVTGIDLTERLAAESAERGWKIFLLGAADGVATKAAAVLQARYPKCQIVGTWAGSPREPDQAAIAAEIRRSQPEIVLVAYGAPAQDLWIRRYGALLGIKLGIGVGGTFDDLAGLRPRAPQWMRKFGLEWLWRLIRHPQRWRRIFTAVVLFGWAAWREAQRIKRG